MELYFAPLSCSMATKIALNEIGETAATEAVSLGDKKTASGKDYWTINPKGQVPALRTREGTILTEGPAVLQYVADLKPDAGLAPPAGTPERYRLQQWLNYVATELHKAVFALVFNPKAPDAVKAYAMEQIPAKFAFLSGELKDRDFLLDRFTVADAYLVTVLNWCGLAGIDLKPYPVLAAYHQRLAARPSVAKAMAEDMKLAGIG